LSEREVLERVLSTLAGNFEIMAAEIREVLKELSPEPEVPNLDLEALPWKKRDKTPAEPGDWAWILGPGSTQGVPEGAEPLVTLLNRHGGKVELPPYEIRYSKDKVFIQRRPLKSNPHNRMEKNLRNIKSAASRKKKVSWKQRLRVNPSNAEIDILIGLEERGLTKGMFRDMEICLEKTIPDYFWPSRGLAVYLDGPVHLKERQRLKDERIDERLRKLGLRVLRISYRSPLSKHLREKILDEIEEALAGE